MKIHYYVCYSTGITVKQTLEANSTEANVLILCCVHAHAQCMLRIRCYANPVLLHGTILHAHATRRCELRFRDYSVARA